jgi:signal transduction histidine kinase
VIAGTIAGEADFRSDGLPLPKLAGRSPLAYLLHALNQPLTGLQCAMEVALGRPRTCEQYVQGLREGLELTERMRALVEAIREVADLEEDKNRNDSNNEESEERETVELRTLLREVVTDLEPAAEVSGVRMLIEGAEDFSVVLRASRPRLASTVFRLLESVLSLAAKSSTVLVETSGAASEGWIRVGWHVAAPRSELSRPELGLVVAQASWAQAGAKWDRERTENRETVTIRLPSALASERNF